MVVSTTNPHAHIHMCKVVYDVWGHVSTNEKYPEHMHMRGLVSAVAACGKQRGVPSACFVAKIEKNSNSHVACQGERVFQREMLECSCARSSDIHAIVTKCMKRHPSLHGKVHDGLAEAALVQSLVAIFAFLRRSFRLRLSMLARNNSEYESQNLLRPRAFT